MKVGPVSRGFSVLSPLDKFFKDKRPSGNGRWSVNHSDATRFHAQEQLKGFKRRRANSALLMVKGNL